MTPQNKLSSGQSFTKKRMESMFDKINIKSLLFSSMVGLIGGVVSTQFWIFTNILLSSHYNHSMVHNFENIGCLFCKNAEIA